MSNVDRKSTCQEAALTSLTPSAVHDGLQSAQSHLYMRWQGTVGAEARAASL